MTFYLSHLTLAVVSASVALAVTTDPTFLALAFVFSLFTLIARSSEL